MADLGFISNGFLSFGFCGGNGILFRLTGTRIAGFFFHNTWNSRIVSGRHNSQNWRYTNSTRERRNGKLVARALLNPSRAVWNRIQRSRNFEISAVASPIEHLPRRLPSGARSLTKTSEPNESHAIAAVEVGRLISSSSQIPRCNVRRSGNRVHSHFNKQIRFSISWCHF